MSIDLLSGRFASTVFLRKNWMSAQIMAGGSDNVERRGQVDRSVCESYNFNFPD
jgi:hypothetical protein